MAIALVQSASGTSTSAITSGIAFSVAPTNGNLIVLGFAADDYNGTADSGWTESTGMEQQTFHGGYCWWRIAAGGVNSFQYTIGSASRSNWILLEFSGVSATPYDVSAGGIEQFGGGTMLSQTLTPSVGDRLLVDITGMSGGSNDLSGVTATYTNSFTEIRYIGNATTPTTGVSAAYRLVTADGVTTYNTTWTQTVGSTPQSRSSMFIAFKAAGGGTLYSDTRTETVTTSDAETSAVTFANPTTQSVASSTVETSRASFANTLAESVTSGDTFTGNTQLLVTDSVTTGESATALATFANTFAESTATGEGETSFVTFVLSLTEAATTSETINGIGGTVLTETSTSGDAFTSVMTGVNALVESAATGDAEVIGGGLASAVQGGSGSPSKKRKKSKKRVTLWEAPAKPAPQPQAAKDPEPPRNDPMIAGRSPDFANLFGMTDGVPGEPAVLRPKPTVQQDIADLVRLMQRL